MWRNVQDNEFPMKVNSITIEFTVHTSCYYVLDLLCVIYNINFTLSWIRTRDLNAYIFYSKVSYYCVSANGSKNKGFDISTELIHGKVKQSFFVPSV